jgi:hypothetical protein
MKDDTDSEGKRIPKGWSREDWEKLTSQQRTYYRTGGGFGPFDPSEGDDD